MSSKNVLNIKKISREVRRLVCALRVTMTKGGREGGRREIGREEAEERRIRTGGKGREGESKSPSLLLTSPSLQFDHQLLLLPTCVALFTTNVLTHSLHT